MEFPPLDFDRIRTYPIRERPNKVHLNELARVWKAGGSFAQFIDSLPRILVGNDFRTIVDATVAAVRNKKPVVVMMGAHTIKCGLNPIFIDLMKRGVISAMAFNGAGAIHDFELAYIGETSEDVQRGLDDGSFGMIDETGRLMNQALAAGVKQGIGAGRALGEAIGTDIIHQHPTTDGSVLGEATYLDFQKFAAVVAKLEGGIVFNIGSAVVMPEVFLKALTIARNLGNKVENLTTATFDMIRHYRPAENVVRRPTHKGGQGYYIIGHHELLVPLWAAATLEQLK